jgi:hypothetical protein
MAGLPPWLAKAKGSGGSQAQAAGPSNSNSGGGKSGAIQRRRAALMAKTDKNENSKADIAADKKEAALAAKMGK